jgi:hypothetical protein
MLLAFIGLSCGCEPLKPIKTTQWEKNIGEKVLTSQVRDTRYACCPCRYSCYFPQGIHAALVKV